MNFFCNENEIKQAGAELGQAQLKLGLDFNLIFCKFDSSGFNLVELVCWILFCKFDRKDLVGRIGS